MKKVITVALLCFLSSFGYTQNDSIPKIDGLYEYSEVVTLDTSYSKDRLYKNAKVYFVDAYKSAKDVIQYDDKEEGKIIGKGFTELKGSQSILLSAWYYTWSVNFSTELFCKDGKYRYRIYAINIKELAEFSDDRTTHNTSLTIDDVIKNCQKGSFKKCYNKFYKDLVISFKETIEDLKKKMAKPEVKTKDDF